MLARSPITRVDQIRTPLLVIQGANDVRVVQAESDNLVEALRARGVEVEYMVKDDEGHGFVNQENVIDMYHAVERFLAEHLGGRHHDQPAPIRPDSVKDLAAVENPRGFERTFDGAVHLQYRW